MSEADRLGGGALAAGRVEQLGDVQHGRFVFAGHTSPFPAFAGGRARFGVNRDAPP
jgi:hypothetical protein